MFYANSIRSFLSSRKELLIVSISKPMPVSIHQQYYKQKHILPSFCLHKSKWWEKRNWLHLLLYCCVLPILTEPCQAWQDLTSPPRLSLSHRSCVILCVLSQRDSRYWYCNNSHTTVSAEYTLSIITLSTLLYLLLFLTTRCINSQSLNMSHCHNLK